MLKTIYTVPTKAAQFVKFTTGNIPAFSFISENVQKQLPLVGTPDYIPLVPLTDIFKDIK